jgi:hypothetical protein
MQTTRKNKKLKPSSIPGNRRNSKFRHVSCWPGYAVAQLVEALRYKPEGRGFDSQWCNWNFSLTYYGPGVDSASSKNEYHEYFLGVKAAGA